MPASLGKYYDAVNSGNVFILSTVAAGTALPIVTGTAGTFGLWNTSTTHNAVLLRITIGCTSGTIALGTFGLASLLTPSFTTATAADITAFTDSALGATLRNAKIGGGKSSMMRSTPSGVTITAAKSFPTLWLGASIESATAGLGIFSANYDLDGSVIVPPGQLVHLAGSVAQTGLFTCSMMWAEVPV